MSQVEERPKSDPQPPVAEVAICFEAGTALITLAGEIDLAMSEGIAFVAEEASLRRVPVRVDLSAVTFMDSVGVGFLARLVRAGSEADWRLTVIGPSRRILETLTISGIVPALDVYRRRVVRGREGEPGWCPGRDLVRGLASTGAVAQVDRPAMVTSLDGRQRPRRLSRGRCIGRQAKCAAGLGGLGHALRATL